MKKKQQDVIAFMDLLGTTYYAQTEPTRYHENLLAFKRALVSRAAKLGGKGNVFLFSDCAYAASSDAQSLIDYLVEVRAALLIDHLYIQAAVEPGELSPQSVDQAANNAVSGTIFGDAVAPLYARQHALKGAAIRVSPVLLKEKVLRKHNCVMSCHLPNPTNSNAECFFDVRYRPEDIDRKQIEAVLEDCIRAKSSRRSAGTYYIPVFVSMIRSVNWTSVNLAVRTAENDSGARHLYELLMRGKFQKHFGDLRGIEYVFFAMLDEVYEHCEKKPICEAVQGYIASRPRLLRHIESVPPELLTHSNRQKFLTSTLVWSRLSDESGPSPKASKKSAGPR